MKNSQTSYPPIADYALISDCHASALISRDGSVDWCCMPRFDDDSSFGRLLDWKKGGHCAITPVDPDYTATRRYLPQTMILETRFHTGQGEALLYDFFAMNDQELAHPRFKHVRIVEGIAGNVTLRVEVCPRFDYGEIVPHMRQFGDNIYLATGSNQGLIMYGDLALDVVRSRDLVGTLHIAQGQRKRLVIQFQFPELQEQTVADGLPGAAGIDAALERTRQWWSDWSCRMQPSFELDAQTLRSSLTLKALTFEGTGAIIAAATTSLPEAMGGERNWDYRFCWVRDSVFTIRALLELGYKREANRFHQFIQRSSAGCADQLQIMYGVDGKRRLTEIELDWLEGYRKSRPIRVGNRAAKQSQFDIYGELLEMAWEWHASGHATDPDYWKFLSDVVDLVCEQWQDRDHGIWEIRSEPAHYVHSKVMCWAALDKGIKLAQDNGFDAPIAQWTKHRDDIRIAIDGKGYDPQRGVYVQAFGSSEVDAALLLLPRVGFVAYDDPRMMRTVDLICAELGQSGLLLRYVSSDNLPGHEGSFLPCTFWLVSCLAYQGKKQLAQEYYQRAIACANELGLFSEEFDADNQQMLGNFPQGLTHVSQIMAKLALCSTGRERLAE